MNGYTTFSRCPSCAHIMIADECEVCDVDNVSPFSILQHGYCSMCGHENEPTAKHCDVCGKTIIQPATVQRLKSHGWQVVK